MDRGASDTTPVSGNYSFVWIIQMRAVVANSSKRILGMVKLGENKRSFAIIQCCERLFLCSVLKRWGRIHRSSLGIFFYVKCLMLCADLWCFVLKLYDRAISSSVLLSCQWRRLKGVIFWIWQGWESRKW